MQDVTTIGNQLNSRDLFEAFKGQLARDFQQSNFPTDFVAALEPNYPSIHQKIMSELQPNEKKTTGNLMALLYRVDISETQLKKYLDSHTGGNYVDVLAELIIKRVLQKVVIKQLYKK
jgi:hypothetical protein